MILLDTNVISALMRLNVERAVAGWLRRQPIEQLCTAAPCVFEIEYGIATNPAGKRRRALQAAFEYVTGTLLDNRVAPFDQSAATAAAQARAVHKKRGISTSIADSQLAGIALSLQAPIATRDVDDFKDLAIVLINPWTAIA